MDRVAILCIFGAVILHCCVAQTVYIVGDGMGSDIPTNSSVSYANWASAKTFMLGDILVFNFMTNQHDVVRVPQASYEACSGDNAIGSIITTGPTNFSLNAAGDHYYICTFGRHCQFGQKLAITVGSSAPGGAPTPPATPSTPSPASSHPGACAPTPSTTPSAGGPTSAPTPYVGPSASTSLAASFLIVLLSPFIVLLF